jgi:hypothetical protein
MLGPVSAGEPTSDDRRDRSASAGGRRRVTYGALKVDVIQPREREYGWLSRAPILRARPGTVEKFSDFPLVMYAEQHVNGESGSRYQLQYTSSSPTKTAARHRSPDGDVGTHDRHRIHLRPHRRDRRRAKRSRPKGTSGSIQGPREGQHPVLWVSTQNNMVADHGPEDAVRFAPAPQLVGARRDVPREGDGRQPVDVRRHLRRDGA